VPGKKTGEGRGKVVKRSIFILIDALGWEKVREMDFLPELAATRTGLRAVLGYSGACQSALFSGKMPSVTGRWLMYYFTERSQIFGITRFLKSLPPWVRSRGRLRRWLRSYVARRVDGYFGLYHVPMEAFPYLDLSEREDLYAPGGLAPSRGIFDDLSDNGIPYSVWTWRVAEEESLQSLIRELEEDRKWFYLVYWTKLDALMHQNGTRADAVDERIRWYENAIRRVMDVASRAGDTRVFVFSDHGMIDTRGTTDVMDAIGRLGFEPGEDYRAFYDSTMARFTFRNTEARRAILDVLEKTDGGRLLSDEELEALGVLYPDHRYGEAIFLTDPGILITPSFMGPSPPKAMHGFHPDCPESDAHLISNVDVGRPVNSILDLYSVMKQELD
jgi:hypothetical protein